MTIKFALKIARLSVYIFFAILMTLTLLAQQLSMEGALNLLQRCVRDRDLDFANVYMASPFCLLLFCLRGRGVVCC